MADGRHGDAAGDPGGREGVDRGRSAGSSASAPTTCRTTSWARRISGRTIASTPSWRGRTRSSRASSGRGPSTSRELQKGNAACEAKGVLLAEKFEAAVFRARAQLEGANAAMTRVKDKGSANLGRVALAARVRRGVPARVERVRGARASTSATRSEAGWKVTSARSRRRPTASRR